MPTTGNQNQENASSEESVLSQNALESPATEMSASEASEPIHQQDTNILETSEVAGVVSSTTMDSDIFVQDVADVDPIKYQEQNAAAKLGQNVETSDSIQDTTVELTSHVVLQTERDIQCSSNVEDLTKSGNDPDLPCTLSSKEEGASTEQTEASMALDSTTHTETMDHDNVQAEPSLNAGIEMTSSELVDSNVMSEENVVTDVDQHNEYCPDECKEVSELSHENVSEVVPSGHSQVNTLEYSGSSSNSTVVTTTEEIAAVSEDGSHVTEMTVAEESVPHITTEAEVLPSEFQAEQPTSAEVTAQNDDAASFGGIELEDNPAGTEVTTQCDGNALFVGEGIENNPSNAEVTAQYDNNSTFVEEVETNNSSTEVTTQYENGATFVEEMETNPSSTEVPTQYSNDATLAGEIENDPSSTEVPTQYSNDATLAGEIENDPSSTEVTTQYSNDATLAGEKMETNPSSTEVPTQYSNDATLAGEIENDPSGTEVTTQYSNDATLAGEIENDPSSTEVTTQYSNDATLAGQEMENNPSSTEVTTQYSNDATLAGQEMENNSPGTEVKAQYDNNASFVGEEVETTPSNEMPVDTATDGELSSNIHSDTVCVGEMGLNGVTESYEVASDSITGVPNVNKEPSDVGFNLEQTVTPDPSGDLNPEVMSSECDQSASAEGTTLNDAPHDTETAPTCTVSETDSNITPSATALVTHLDDDLGTSQDSVGPQSSPKQSSSLPHLSNSFQSAFAAFASASTSQDEDKSSSMEVDADEANQLSDNVTDTVMSTKSQESKKISVLQMPQAMSSTGSLMETDSASDPIVIEPAADGGLEQTQVLEENASVQADQNQEMQPEASTSELTTEGTVASDAVYFIQMTDTSGEVVTSIIDPNDIASYSDSIVYKQCMGSDGQIETTIVSSGGVPYQEEQGQQQQQIETAEPQPEMEQQVIYAHDLNGQLTPIDSAQSANDVAPPGKQFVYMQDSSGRIIRTIMDANQTMVPGQQVYYTQSEDGRITTSVMDSESTEETAPQYQQAQEVQANQQLVQQQPEQSIEDPSVPAVTQQSSASGFAIDNSMSGLSMLAELSHLTAGQGSVELKGTSTENSSQDADMDEFRPVAMITRRVAEDGVETVNSDLANLKMAQGIQGAEGSESMLAKLTDEIKGGSTLTPASVSRDNLFVQWQNLDAMCWMDVVLIMLVYSPSLQPLVNLDPSHELASTLLITLLKANRQAQVLLQNLLKRSSDAANTLQNGAGNATSTLRDAKTSKLVCKENMDEIGKAINILYAMREQIWQALQPRLRCERGKHNSPVLVLPLLVREKPVIKQMFTMNFRYVFKCDKCGYSQDDTHSKILPTIPAVPANFNMKDPCFVRNCFECQAPNQRMLMKFEGLQDFVQMHFVKGLPHNRFEELGFDHNNDRYEVTAVVHYKNNPDHFIAWVRNAPGNTWMECDDLKSVITRYQCVKPCIPPSQVHMVMWERRLTPEQTLVMRDTEDTKLLSSLVLTVQQPTGTQTTQDAPAAAKVPAATASSLLNPSMTQGTASSFLSGLITQSQQSSSANTFSPYTPRGRGRGARGRGSRGGRNSTVTIRRGLSPANNQMISPVTTTAIRQPGSPQIIRLPLSALQGMGAQLRGSSANSSQRLILMGGNSSMQSAQSTSSTPKKVVVVRSQDGSTGLNQLSATQLLQLLQRTGAISNANTRITTTISRAASDGTTQQQTITLTPESQAGQLSLPVTSTDSNNLEAVHSTPVMAEPMEETSATEQTMEVDPSIEGGQTPATLSAISQGEDASQTTAPVEGISETGTESPSAAVTSVVSVPSTLSSESNLQSKISTVNINSGAIRTLSRAGLGDGNRYVQIPNPKGGPNIMTQLVVRGDKMMLLPVEKSTQSQVSSSVSAPVMRLSGTSSLLSGALQASSATATATQVLSSPSSIATTAISTGSSGQTARYITIPGGQGQGGKRTIQLISVPRGSTSTGASSGPTKTFIVGPSGSHTASRLISQSQDVASPQQANNIIVREVKRVEDDSTSVATTTLALPLSGEGGTQTPLTGSSAVSLLRDITVKSKGSSPLDGAQGISILSSSAVQAANKAQESFKYILPGSNTPQMASIQTMSGAQLGSKAFTALSSSGTIIGGQLTTVSTNTQDMTPSPVECVDAGVQSIYPELEAISPSVLTSARGRGRGSRGARGRGRGAKTPGRGRGGRQQQIITQNTFGQVQQVQTKVVGRGGTISMLPADFHGVGGQIIEASSESVDGAPVVSIPDFSTAATTIQTESLVTSESDLVANTNQDPLYQTVQSVPSSSPLHTLTTQESSQDALNQGPRVITQTIPSIKANHGFDILTQGILGTANTQTSMSTPRKTGISLLTGKQVSSPPSTNLLSSSPFTTGVSRMQQTLAMGHSVSQSEIETLIKAAQGAAKPPKPGQSSTISDVGAVPLIQGTQESSENSAVAQDQAFNVDDFLSAVKNEDKSQMVPEKVETKIDAVVSGGDELQSSIEDSKKSEYSEMDTSVPELPGNGDDAEGQKPRVFSVDESQVSAAERYRMPTELFQPDEESPEKPVRNDGLSNQFSSSNILGEDLPAKLFHDSEMSSQDDEIVKSPTQRQRKDSFSQKSAKSVEKDLLTEMVKSPGVEMESIEEKEMSDAADVSMEGHDLSADTSQEIVDGVPENIGESTVDAIPSKKGRKRAKGRGQKHAQNKGGGRRKSSNSISTDMEDTVTVQLPQVISSPQKESADDPKTTLSVGGFGIDILRETEEKVKPVKNMCSEISEEAMAGQEEEKEPEIKTEDKEQVDKKIDFGSKSDQGEKKKGDSVEEKNEGKENMSPVKDKVRALSPLRQAHVSNKKQKMDWSREEDVEKAPVVFNYRLLTRTRKKASQRHASLGPRVSSFTCAPLVPVLSLRDKGNPHEALTCLVNRRQPKALERPNVDPSKEPTVIPLAPEEDADPACTCGGSVVTSHSDGEVFTGVVVRQRPEVADWNSVIFDDEGDTQSEKWEDKESLDEYLETMWTSMCMEIGFEDFFEDFNKGDGESEDDNHDDDEGNESCNISECKEDESAIVTGEELADKSSSVIDSENVTSINSDGKRKLDEDDENSAASGDSKRMRPSFDEEESSEVISKSVSSSDTITTVNEVTRIETNVSTVATASEETEAPTIATSTTEVPTIATTVTKVQIPNATTKSSSSGINGISKAESPAEHVVSTLPFGQPSTSASTFTSSSTSTSKSTSAPSSSTSAAKKCGISSPAFISPARRSSRTPVPSLKVRDSLDEGVATKILSKARRSSLVSSDDDLSGYSSDELAMKKKVKKYHVHS